jgi:hypothetical protein
MLPYLANGTDIVPEKIDPKLIIVNTQEKSDLFRYASYLWSIPISNGFGRRLRYLVMDKNNNKLIGIIGITDPVIGLKVRDDLIGWDKNTKERRLWHVMDLYAFGAIPPYSHLLGGKLVATLATSNQVRNDFLRKYSKGRSTISGRNYKSRKGGLVLLTTTGAFGESSILDRLKTENNELLWQFMGYTQGWGSFHLNNGISVKMHQYLIQTKNQVMKTYKFGEGSNWNMRVIRVCMKELGINYSKYGKHGIKRGFYISPLASNYKEFLTGKDKKPKFHNRTAKKLFAFYKERYLLPRASRNDEWKNFDKTNIRVSNNFI